MAKGRFNRIKGTKDFLVMAVACACFCLWAVSDAWFPSKRVLKKHPQEVAVAMKVSGVIKSLPLKTGAEIHGEAVLASVHDGHYKKIVAAADAEFTKAKESREGVDEALGTLLSARADLKNCILKNTDVVQKTSHGEDVLRGVILEHLVDPATSVRVVKAESAGRVSKITEDAVFISEGDSIDAREYPVGDDMVPVVNLDEEIVKGDALAGTPVLLVEPHDTFYLFNQTLAVLMFIGFTISLVFHRIASR